MNFIVFIMLKIHFINYLKLLFISNFERKIQICILMIFIVKFSPLANIDPVHANMNALFVELVEDSLTEFVYPAQLGGLQYDLSALNYGIQLTIYGFNHRIKQLLDKVIDHLVNIKVQPQRFEMIKEKVKKLIRVHIVKSFLVD